MKFKIAIEEVESIFALTPRRCQCCGKTLWLEKVWYRHHRYFGQYFKVYCCTECARNEEEAQKKCVITTTRPERPFPVKE